MFSIYQGFHFLDILHETVKQMSFIIYYSIQVQDETYFDYTLQVQNFMPEGWLKFYSSSLYK